MSSKRPPKVDPRAIDASYTFDLREKNDWSGELSYTIENNPIPGIQREGLSSISTIAISATLSETSSKKIKKGTHINIQIYIGDGDPEERIGFIEKTRRETLFAIGLPWEIANHLHMILISNKATTITFSGTELYRGSGLIYGINITKASLDEAIARE